MTPRRILLLRTDRIGDVVLTLPMVDLIKARYPEASVTFLVRDYTRELVDGYPGVDGVITLETVEPGRDMFASIRNGGFDVAFHVFPRPELAWLPWRAGIPMRVGTSFRWYSFFFNKRIPDHRKRSGLHESILNVRLLRAIGITAPESVRPTLRPTRIQQEAAEKVLARKGIGKTERFVVLHPGSGGSARDWPAERFAALARELTTKGVRVAVTGSGAEASLVSTVTEATGGRAVPVAGEMSLMELGAFVSRASLFVSNSTGPLHIASAVGTPVIGLFPPYDAASVKRWGPLAERVATFVPDKSLCERCRGTECQGNTCMDQITVEAVRDRSLEMLR